MSGFLARIIPAILLVSFGVVFDRTLSGKEPPIVDLVGQPAENWQRPAISGAFEGASCFDCPTKREPNLPLEVRLESIKPLPGHPQEFLVSIVIRNNRAESYSLPVGRDPDVALKPGNRGRREYWFDLKLAGERYSYLRGQETYGSTDVPNTMLAIPSKAVVRFRFKLNVAGEFAHTSNHLQGTPPPEIRVGAAIVDEAYDDDPNQYVVHGAPLDALSSNKLLLRLASDPPPAQNKR